MIGARILLVVLSLFFLIFNAGANGLDPRALSIDDIPTCGVCHLNQNPSGRIREQIADVLR
jgi:hypothetical protein